MAPFAAAMADTRTEKKKRGPGRPREMVNPVEFSIRVPGALHDRLKLIAYLEGDADDPARMNPMVVEALEQWCARHPLRGQVEKLIALKPPQR